MSRKLTKDFLRSRLGNDDFENIKSLNLWGNNIDDISLLKEMPSLEIISLNVNHIKDLRVFSHLKNVKELYLKDNKISNFNQIEYLKNCPNLEKLLLLDNPISKQPNYIQKILEILPNLKKLDDLEIKNSNNNTDNDKNSPPARLTFPNNSFILFKKIFPKKPNKLLKDKIVSLNTSTSEQFNQINKEESKNKSASKGDLLNNSFQKKKTIGTFRKIGNKKNNINLDLSVEYEKNNIINDPNRTSYIGDNKSNNIDMISAKDKYNKKVVGQFKKDHIKNYQSTMLSYQEFDEPIKKEENKKNLYDNNKNNKISIGNSFIKSNKKETVILQSIRILLETLNLSELQIVNEDIQKIIKDKTK